MNDERTRSHATTAAQPALSAAQSQQLGDFAARAWDERIVPELKRYIEVPAKSPMFDAQWQSHGYIDHVVRAAAAWVESRKVAGLKLEVIRLEGRTPVILFEVPATKAGSTGTVVMYGHLDKQPEFNGWRNDLGPWTPKLDDGLLYGRGGADDGYAVFAAITAIEALDAQGIPRPRCVGLDRELRGERLVRPAGLPRRVEAAPGRRVARRLPGLRCRQLRPAVAHHLAARHGVGRAEGRDPDRGRALGRRQRAGAVELSHPAAVARSAGRLAHRPSVAAGLSLPGARRAGRPGARGRGDARPGGVAALSVGLRRRRRRVVAHHHRSGGGAAQSHVAADACR